jgi:hypothetical protein
MFNINPHPQIENHANTQFKIKYLKLVCEMTTYLFILKHVGYCQNQYIGTLSVKFWIYVHLMIIFRGGIR